MAISKNRFGLPPTLVVLLCLLSKTIAMRTYGECSSTLSCDDPGLICHDGKCTCIIDRTSDVIDFWSCDSVLDCEGPLRFATDQLSYLGLQAATESINLEEPKCAPSTTCRNAPGRKGYCDIFWPDGDAL